MAAQLVERSLATPEIRGSNPNIGKILSSIILPIKAAVVAQVAEQRHSVLAGRV